MLGRETVLIIFRNDCAPALAALEKGSSRWPQLQAASVELHKQRIARGVFPRFLRVSGTQLVEQRVVDDGSRGKARWLKGPRRVALP